MVSDSTRQSALGDGDPASRYDASSIGVFSGLEAVRRYPSMYVGSAGAEGLHQLVRELLDNSVDEATAGWCRKITVTLHRDGSCSVADDGRGIPVDPHPESGRPASEVVLTTLHAGGKFGSGAYGISAGVHGVGLSCVNALSEWLVLDVCRDGGHHNQRFIKGRAETDLKLVGPSAEHGTVIRFLPDASVLEEVDLSADVIASRMAELAYLRPRLVLELADERTGAKSTFIANDGVAGLIRRRNACAQTVHPEPVTVSSAELDILFDLALQWTEGYGDDLTGFVNTVRTDDGGHVEGMLTALTSALNEYIIGHRVPGAGNTYQISPLDVREGLTAVISVWLKEPRFDSQTKKRLQNPGVADAVGRRVRAAFLAQLEADEDLARRIVDRALDATRARLAARQASRTIRIQRRELVVDYSVYQRQFGIRSKNWHDSCSWLTDNGLLVEHAKLCDVPADARMLDVCCGSGVVGDAFRGRVGEMIGLDITPEMVALAATRLDEVHQGTVYDLPYPDASFDLVVNREVLHLLPGPQRPVSEIFRVLRSGGQFIVGQIVPYADEDAFWMYRIFKKKQPLLYQMFLEAELRQLLLGAGFVDLNMSEYFLWESIDRWTDTHETTPLARREIFRLFAEAPQEVRDVHPFEIETSGSVRDRWRWCVYSVRKPA
jgi:DNA gyrase subunit B